MSVGPCAESWAGGQRGKALGFKTVLKTSMRLLIHVKSGLGPATLHRKIQYVHRHLFPKFCDFSSSFHLSSIFAYAYV